MMEVAQNRLIRIDDGAQPRVFYRNKVIAEPTF